MKTIKSFTIPDNVQAAVLTEFGKPFEIKEVPLRKPKKGEVLVKMHSSPINPSDYAFVNGNYSSKKVPPVIPGFEGSGQVVASGSGYMAGRLLGKNVAGFAPLDGNGTWAQYMVTKANFVIPVRKGIDMSQASMMFVNPLTAYAFVEIAKKRKLKGIVNTAGASALGQMLQVMCKESGLELVSIVRRQEQVKQLEKLGGKHVFNTSNEGFEKDLMKILKSLRIRLAFDAVSDSMPELLLKALPQGGEVMIYGSLSEKNLTIEPGHFIFSEKKVSGFWLSKWITKKNPLQMLRVFGKIQKFLDSSHTIEINKRLALSEIYDGVGEYMEKMSRGKMIVQPWKE